MSATCPPLSSAVRITRFNLTCVVPREHPSPLALRSKLVEVAKRELPSACTGLLASLFPENDSSIWLIRRLDMDVPVDAHWDTDQLARVWSKSLARSLSHKMSKGDDGANVLRFPNRPLYLAQFLRDLADGMAWSKWYYDGFVGLCSLPEGAALREAICSEPAIGGAALMRLAENGRIDGVPRAMSEADCRTVLTALNGRRIRCAATR